MNYLKIYTLLLCAVLIAACSDDEEQFNSGAATVNLQETAMTVKESAGLCTVPVVVTGEHTGTIRVTFELKDHNAKEDENYIVTTKTLLIPAGQETMNFEFKTVDDKLVNDDRSFDVEIADVKGASIGENKRLTVTIKDNDSSFYETLSGTWVFTGTASATNVSNVPVGFSVRVNTAEEGTEAYEHYLVCSNKNGFVRIMILNGNLVGGCIMNMIRRRRKLTCPLCRVKMSLLMARILFVSGDWLWTEVLLTYIAENMMLKLKLSLSRMPI
ncbi:Calx-beta domain-containing protein [Bacteroides ovatus]|uniref:Calx-beta domain-containing protein n=1 Tax=Bacteroides ovatus TaxID=28116 RepID=UPI0022E6900E|nr:Calx-beta domain-containing protein [Bacteroides ovatus]